MWVRSELTWPRLAVGLLFLAALPALLALAAVNYRSPDLPPGPADYSTVSLHPVPVLDALLQRELERSRRVAGLAAALAAPGLVPPAFPEPVATIALTPRATAYTLDELRTLLPAAFGTADGAVLLLANIEVPAGAQLTVGAATTPQLRMLSSAAGFTTVIARGGSVELQGSEQTPVHVSSWDPDTGSADVNTNDGRSFLLTFGGRMDIVHAEIDHLGFGRGSSSGVAWHGSEPIGGDPGMPATGDVRDSVLHDNWFGAFTFEAAGMVWTRNTFRDNIGYGFDPHDSSNEFVVAGNVAHGNGRHGFIFSRGCNRNVLRNNVAYDNRGHGFMIDDGRSGESADPGRPPQPSNDNILLGNHAYSNDGSGIEVEGGRGTVVDNNRLENNHVGVRVKNDASALVAGNTIQGSGLAGVDVLAGNGDVHIRDNGITGGWAGVSLTSWSGAALTDNRIQGTSTPLVVGGDPQRAGGPLNLIGRVLRWNPVLLLWITILGVPTVLTLRQVVRTGRHARRRNLIRWS
jgi:parallel beta-helix repeat protein